MIYGTNQHSFTALKLYRSLIVKSKKNMLAEDHKKFERRRHVFIIALKAQDKKAKWNCPRPCLSISVTRVVRFSSLIKING